VLQRAPGNLGGATELFTFEGIGFTGVRPPDPIGSVGLNHYLQMVNFRISIYDKLGNLLVGPVAIHTLFSGPGLCATSDFGDPFVVYDQLAARWVIGQIRSDRRGICVAVSQTDDPVAGGFYTYEVDTGDDLPDYPKLGVWPDGYYIGTNSINRAMALDRLSMLDGGPTNAIMFQPPGVGLHGMLMPGDMDGFPPPDGAPNLFYRHIDHLVGGGVDRVELFEFHADFADPPSSTLTGPIQIPVAPFNSLCGFDQNCVQQPGTTQRLDSITEWPMWRLAYRNFDKYEVLLANNAVDAGDGQAAIRWYELRKPAGGDWDVYQQGSYAPDTVSRWMASIAMDSAGNIGVVYSASDSSSVFPSLRFSGRFADDPPGELTFAEQTVGEGTSAQTGLNGYRYGDYASASVDPADGCTFWVTGEYLPEGNAWHTRLGVYQIPGCGDVK
jgi:hypothetical protein